MVAKRLFALIRVQLSKSNQFFKQSKNLFLPNNVWVYATALCFFVVGCGVDTGNEYIPSAIESNNSVGLKDRVYLALDEVEVSGIKTKAYYIVGCHGEPTNPEAQISVYHPTQGWIEKGLHERKWLWEFNPFREKKGTRNGDCEILLGDPSIQKFKYEPRESSSWFASIGLTGAGCLGMAASIGALVMDHNGLSLKAFLGKSPPKQLKHFFAATGTLTGGFFCAKNGMGLLDEIKNKQADHNRKLFAKMFDLAFQDSLNFLSSSEVEIAKEYREAMEASDDTSEAVSEAYLKGVGILAEKTVETFNGDLTLWKKSTDEDLQKGQFDQGYIFDVLRGHRQFFDAIKDFGKVHWDVTEESSLHDIPDEIRSKQFITCDSLEVRDHELLKGLKGAPVFLDKDLSYRIGFLPVGTPLERVSVKQRTSSRQLPASKVEILPSDMMMDENRLIESTVWIHPVFTEVRRTQSCTFSSSHVQE